MTTKTRVVLQAENGFLQAEVQMDAVTFQDTRSGNFIVASKEFFDDVVDTVIEVTGDDTYKALEAQLAAETERRRVAEATVRALEGQLAGMRALLQPKPVEKLADVED